MRLQLVRRAGTLLLLALALGLLASPATAATRTATAMRVEPVATVNWGDRALVYAYLTLTDGTPLGNVHVDVHINGDVSGGRTDDSGKASFNPKTPTEPGTYLVTVTFNGSSTALPSQASTTLTVKPRTLTISTVPAQQGLGFVLDGKEFFTDATGVAETIVAPTYDPANLPEAKSLKVAPGVEQRFARWRTHNGALVATYEMYYDISLRFVDLAGNQIEPSRVARVVFKSAVGENVSVTPTQPFTVLGQRVIALTGEFLAKDITYAAQDVLVDGSSVVHVAQQRFTPSQERVWTLHLLFYAAHFSVRDALFGFPIDATVAVTYPDGHEVSLATKHGELSLVALARGDYHVAARGLGISFSRPVALSRDQQVELKFISYLDVAVVGGAVVLVALGLVALGRPGRRLSFRPRLALRQRLAAIRPRLAALRLRLAALRPRLTRKPTRVPLAADGGSAGASYAGATPSGASGGSAGSGLPPLVERASEAAAPALATLGSPAMHDEGAAAPETSRVPRPQAAPATEPLSGRIKTMVATAPSAPTTSRLRPQAAPATEPLEARLEAARLEAARATAVATRVPTARARKPQAIPAPGALTSSASEAPTPAPATGPAKGTPKAASEPDATKPPAARSTKSTATRPAKRADAAEPKEGAAPTTAKQTEKPAASGSARTTTRRAARKAASETTPAKADAPAAARRATAKPLEELYVVRRGDTLRTIAARALGDEEAWEQILRANPDVVFDPDRIPPGTRLKIR